MRKFLSLAVLAALLGGFAVPSFAEDKPKPDPEQVFKKKDANGDGKLSMDEFVGKLEGEKADKAKAAFAKKDKDGDGFLTLEEFKAGGKKAK